MSNHEPIDPVDEDLAKLCASERRARAPEEALARVWSRLGPIVPPPHGGGNTGTSAPAHGWLASHAVGVAVATFVGGVAAGAALHAAVQKPPLPRVIYIETPASPPAPAPSNAPVPWVEESASSPPVVPAPPPPRATLPPRSVPDSLRTERDVLDHARSLLTSGDANDALTLLDDHASHFLRPQLGEEREALAIQALVALHRYDEARERARRFHEASPNSLFAPVIDAAIGAIP